LTNIIKYSIVLSKEGGMPKNKGICYACGVSIGELHNFGCDGEQCPFCGDQLISCNCFYEYLGINQEEEKRKELERLKDPLDNEIILAVEDGDKQIVWSGILERKGQISFGQESGYRDIFACANCGGDGECYGEFEQQDRQGTLHDRYVYQCSSCGAREEKRVEKPKDHYTICPFCNLLDSLLDATEKHKIPPQM